MQCMIRMAILVCLGWLSGCSTQLANYDYDPGANTAQYQKYVLQQSEKQSYQSLDAERIEAAIKQALEGRYQWLKTGPADFVVAYYLEEDRQVDTSGVSFGFGIGSGNVGMGVSTGPEAKQVLEGKLVIDVLDADSNRVVWNARATRNIKPTMSPQQRSALIQEVVSEMFNNFPP